MRIKANITERNDGRKFIEIPWAIRDNFVDKQEIFIVSNPEGFEIKVVEEPNKEMQENDTNKDNNGKESNRNRQ